ncbi:MAG: indole-3-glycerol phosphate synthase TrpC [Chlamydiales bacterium]|nr:indole-3-glycerol phosphate synthase TrpC [Chlamydiia bacterium]MCP5504633.1 indole-3-glycerol phosphate synthase TrpC [Chlamydiales bacterium]
MTFLDQIIERKREEVERLKEEVGSDPYHPLHGEIKRRHLKRFQNALRKKGVIAEIKRKSPSKGEIDLSLDPIKLAQEYEAGGAVALSILTDKEGFGGTIKDLEEVKKEVRIPILQKDFIIDPLQIKEAINAGADAILLIVAVLKDQTGEFLRIAEYLGIDALVEVHTKEELHFAIEAGATIIGINNRDLKTFKVDLSNSLELIKLLPKECIKVAESGIKSVEDAQELFEEGFDALLIGETLVKAKNPKEMLGEMNDSC